jgi:hypothetical protein
MTVEELLSALSGYGVDHDVVVEIASEPGTRVLTPVTRVDALFVEVPDAEDLFIRLRT